MISFIVHLSIHDMTQSDKCLKQKKTYWKQTSDNKDPRPHIPVVEICQAEHFIYFSRQEN